VLFTEMRSRLGLAGAERTGASAFALPAKLAGSSLTVSDDAASFATCFDASKLRSGCSVKESVAAIGLL
jgi:hypothetical protein